eukprot:gene25722-31061_t
MDEAYASIALGVCVGLGVIIFLPNDPKPKKNAAASQPPKATAITSGSPNSKGAEGEKEEEEIHIDKDVKEALQKKPHLQKFFGVHVEPPVEKTDAVEEDDAADWDMLALAVKFFFYVGMCTVLCVLLNFSSNGEFGRFLLGMFPVEMEALKLTKLLQRFKLR